jgi:hypothetical protein
MDGSQAAQSSVSSGQITSMQQHGSGGTGEQENYPVLDAFIFGGLGGAKSLSLQNVGLGKLFTSGELTAGLHAPAGKSLGNAFKGLDMSFEMAQEGAGGGDAGHHAGDAGHHADHHEQHGPDAGHHQHDMGGHGYDPNSGPHQGNDHSNSNMMQPDGAGHPYNDGGGMGRGRDTDNPYGNPDDKGMFASWQEDPGPYRVNPFSGQYSGEGSGSTDAQLENYKSHIYDKADKKNSSGTGSNSGSDNRSRNKQDGFDPTFENSVGNTAISEGDVVGVEPNANSVSADVTPLGEGKGKRKGREL